MHDFLIPIGLDLHLNQPPMEPVGGISSMPYNIVVRTPLRYRDQKFCYRKTHHLGDHVIFYLVLVHFLQVVDHP